MKARELAGLSFGSAPITPPSWVENTIRDWRAKGGAGRVWIVVESLYSMDGDFAPLAELIGIADRHDAFLMVDEAHATGVFGEQGRGLAASYEGRETLVVVHTCGKALDAAGALVTGTRVLRDFMVNRCRPFIFATAPSPLIAVAVREALLILQEEPERQQRLASLVAFTHREIIARGGLSPSDRLFHTSLVTMRVRCGLHPGCKLAGLISVGSDRRPCRRGRPGCAFP